MNNYNFFDNIKINLKELNELDFPLRRKKIFLFKLIQRYFFGIMLYFKIFGMFIDSGFIRYWFNDFKIFWIKYLNGRPIYFHDFFYLLGHYRVKFQSINLDDENNDQKFLDAWQNSRAIYLLFGNVRKYSYRPLHGYFLEKYINSNDKILEYGCGIAPLSYSLINFSLKKNLEITIADILQINFIYAKYLLNGLCKFKLLTNKNHSLESSYYDLIIVQAVLEHIPDPINTIKSLHSSLKSGGLLIFDYIVSSQSGHDTIASATYRKDVLMFIKDNFTIIEGKIDVNNSMPTTIVKKNSI